MVTVQESPWVSRPRNPLILHGETRHRWYTYISWQSKASQFEVSVRSSSLIGHSVTLLSCLDWLDGELRNQLVKLSGYKPDSSTLSYMQPTRKQQQQRLLNIRFCIWLRELACVCICSRSVVGLLFDSFIFGICSSLLNCTVTSCLTFLHWISYIWLLVTFPTAVAVS